MRLGRAALNNLHSAVGWAVKRLIVTGEVDVRSERPFAFGMADLVRWDSQGNPLQLAPELATVRESVVCVEAFADGRLEFACGSSALSTADPSQATATWNLVSLGDARLAATTGGGVTVCRSRVRLTLDPPR